MPNARYSLFEVSWETCNKVGGIYTVLSTKAKTMTRRLGDDYITVGPWLLSDTDRDIPFDEEPGFEDFGAACREMGLPVKIGRWRTPGRPRTILVEFSGLYDQKDDVLSELWEEYGVDSLHGEWDYIEPVLFGHAAGQVIEKWWEEYLAPNHRRAVVQAHEWMTGSSLLYLKTRVPSIGTVFTTHATMLGRALSSLGHNPDDGLGNQTPEDLAVTHGVVSKHSMEGTCARQADVFTTVSEITAKEAAVLHRRAPEPVLPNGIDLDVVDEVREGFTRDDVRSTLNRIAGQFLGEDVSDASFLCVSGRYEFHNKGIDVLLDALARMNAQAGRRVILFVLVPAGNSGLRSEMLERLESTPEQLEGAIGISTHNLFDVERDPLAQHCARVKLTNSPGARIKVIHIPLYLSETDGFLDMPYVAALSAMDVSCFPSYYEPWGYTPQESLAVGVPTITSDYAGFGRWVQSCSLTPQSGVTVLARVHRQHEDIVADLADVLEGFLRSSPSFAKLHDACRETARMTAWSDLIANYDQAYEAALAQVQLRLETGVPQARKPRPTVVLPTSPKAHEPRLMPFDVAATLPAEIAGLQRLAQNYWWCWDPQATELFAELSPRAWESCGHNPLAFLQRAYPEDLAAKAADAKYVARLVRVLERFDAYMDAGQRDVGLACAIEEGACGEGSASCLSPQHPIAYFCAEFGIHESLPVYSGGLGVLAGDHVKSASDLALPFVAVGLFYRMGYMNQRLSSAAEQIAVDVENDPRALPMKPVLESDGTPLEVVLHLPGRELFLRAWTVQAGRVTVYLLDSNTPSNRPEDRDITRNLYGGDHEMRLRQEIALGRGGVRLLRRLGLSPAVYHINEGHAAFLTLERVSQLAQKEGLTFDAAREFVRATTVFTTHTPVPAGHDRFGEDLMRRYFADAPDWVGVPWERFFQLGQAEEGEGSFNMTYLAMNFASSVNGVSRLHGEASRELLHPFWPGLLESEVPVGYVTNGIHLASWTHPAVAALLGRTEGAVRGEDFERGAAKMSMQEFWKAKAGIKAELIAKVGENLRKSFLDRSDSPALLTTMLDGLDENALLIGFARRFAPYKRAHLLFKDPARLREILDDPERPVRILVAGKAHPNDQHGRSILQDIARLARSPEFAGKVFFVENYDIHLARKLVQGVDVWLNNPTRMLEASGTSGMKAAANGGLNLSIGDGWWPEAYDGENGWMIAGGRVYADQELQDQHDSGTLYRLLSEEIVPLYYERNRTKLPAGWLAKVQHNLATIPPVFNTDRMVNEYLDKAYALQGQRYFDLSADRKSLAKSIAAAKHRTRREFERVEIAAARVADLSDLHVGDPITVAVDVQLGALTPADVVVEFVLGYDLNGHDLVNRIPVELAPEGPPVSGRQTFAGSHTIERSGNYAYGIRVRAQAPVGTGDQGDSLRDLVLWA